MHRHFMAWHTASASTLACYGWQFSSTAHVAIMSQPAQVAALVSLLEVRCMYTRACICLHTAEPNMLIHGSLDNFSITERY